MPNDYHVPKINGLPVLDPKVLMEGCEGSGLPADFWGKANSLTNPIGMEPGTAYFVVRASEMESIDLNGWQNITWEYNAGSPGDTRTLTFNSWVIVNSHAVTSNTNTQAAWLVTLADRRAVLGGPGYTCSKSYNIPRPRFEGADYTTNRYWPDTMKPSGGSYPPSPWTWQEVLADLWALLPSTYAGSCPTLAWNPTHAPYNLAFRGWRTWDAIAAVLECCQSTLSLAPAGGFSVVLLGSTQTGLSFGSLDSRRVIDWAPKKNTIKTQAPATFRICFPVRGRDSMTTAVSHRWHDRRFHVVDQSSGLEGAEAGTILPVIASLSAEMDVDGTTCLNNSECATAASALASKCADRIKTIGYDDWVAYHGLHDTIPTGSQVHLIRWRDYGDGDGARTDYITDSSWSVPSRIPRVNIEHFNEAHLMARTCERYGYTYPSYSYPVRGDRRLPISYQRYVVESNGALTWTDFSENADADAICISPPGWFPPKVKVELTHDQSWWRVSGWPPIMYVVPVAAIDAQTCTLTGGYGDTPRYTPGRGDARVYIYEPITRDYILQLYNDNTPVVVEIVNTSCQDTGTDPLIAHLNRDEEWTVEDRAAGDELKPRTLKAYDCINLGDTGSTAKVQRKNGDGEWEDDPDYPDPVTVDNELCRAYAAKGWTFLGLPPSAGSAGGCNCGSGSSSVPPSNPKWIPLGPAGPIIVRVTDSVACGATGTGKVLKASCSSTCSESLSEDEKDQCTVTFCNKTNRKLAAESTGSDETKYEDIELTAIGCCWYALDKRRAERAEAVLAQKLCSTDANALLTDSIVYKNVCDWPWNPTQARNPYKHEACSGSVLEISWAEDSHDWYVSDVVRVPVDIVTRVRTQGCDLYTDMLVGIAVEGCGEGVCSAPKPVMIEPPTQTTPKTIIESYLTCDGTSLTEHRRTTDIAMSGWCITIDQHSWQDTPAGCCSCSSSPPPPSSIPPSSSVPPPSDSVPPSSVPPSSVPPSSTPPCGGLCAWQAYDDVSVGPPELTIVCQDDLGFAFSWGTPVSGQLSYHFAIEREDDGETIWSSGCVNIGPSDTGGNSPPDMLLPGLTYGAVLTFYGQANCLGGPISTLTTAFGCAASSSVPPPSSVPPSSSVPPPTLFVVDLFPTAHVSCGDCGAHRSELNFNVISYPANTATMSWSLIDMETQEHVVVYHETPLMLGPRSYFVPRLITGREYRLDISIFDASGTFLGSFSTQILATWS